MIETPPKDALSRFFPEIESFRDCQEEAVTRVFGGQSTLLLMPTGRGKSLTYQLPVLASGKIGIIISPLIALMQQQSSKLLERENVNVLSLGGARDAKTAQEQLKNFDWENGPGFLFVSPERAEADGYLEYLLAKNREHISLVAVDEAHCISQWGHDFRPPYKNIPKILNRCFGNDEWPTLLCLTATLGEESKKETLADFGMTEANIVKSDNMLRSNLDLSFSLHKDSAEKREVLEELLEEHRGKKLIVYVHRKSKTKNGTRFLAEHFKEKGHSCAPFDADLPQKEKAATLEQFASGELKVVFATGAFGMGVDIPDIRGIIHFLLPPSLENYYQEVGRAGRDGQPAFGRLLYCARNGQVQSEMLEKSRIDQEEIREVWDKTINRSRHELKSVHPQTAFANDDQHALFYMLSRIGAVEIVARGPTRLKCFDATGCDLLDRLKAGSRIQNTGTSINKLGLDPSETITALHSLYDASELRLQSSPDKSFFYRTRELTDEEIGKVATDYSANVDNKLRKLEEFVDLIESGSDPTEALRSRFAC